MNQWQPMIDRSRNLVERFEALLLLRAEYNHFGTEPRLTFDEIETIIFSLNQTARLMGSSKYPGDALAAAIRAAKLALFIIGKQGVMPNSSWESGFDTDLKTAEIALAALKLEDVK